MTLPSFTYHPNPLATGAVARSDAQCQCCGKTRGYVYESVIYSDEDIDVVCPWCIADGSVFTRFGGTLVDPTPLVQASVSETAIAEVTQRTPGYICWQQDSWMACCQDACEFHGDASVEELQNLDSTGLEALSRESGFSIADLTEILVHYTAGGSPAFYKFVCRHCGRTAYNGDCH